jgi:CheY-like chemotaxis protein
MHFSTKSPEIKLLKPLALLVDDDPLVFQFMTRYLIDYIVLETTVSAEIAFSMLKEKKYDLIFMDINLMRGFDGKKAASMIRLMEGYESTPIIAATAYAMSGDKEEFISAGCSHYLSKPFNKKQVIDVVIDALKK